MTDLNIKTAEDLANYVRQKNLDYVKVGVFDIDGVMRGKYMGRDKFLSSLEKGFGFCDVVLGWDSNDQLYDNVKVTGWHTAYPDADGAPAAGDDAPAAVRKRSAARAQRIRRRGTRASARAGRCAAC